MSRGRTCPGCGRSMLAGMGGKVGGGTRTPRRWPFCVSWDGSESGLGTRPGCSRCALPEREGRWEGDVHPLVVAVVR